MKRLWQHAQAEVVQTLRRLRNLIPASLTAFDSSQPIVGDFRPALQLRRVMRASERPLKLSVLRLNRLNPVGPRYRYAARKSSSKEQGVQARFCCDPSHTLR